MRLNIVMAALVISLSIFTTGADLHNITPSSLYVHKPQSLHHPTQKYLNTNDVAPETAPFCQGITFTQLHPATITYSNNTIVMQNEIEWAKGLPLSTPFKIGVELVKSNRFPINMTNPRMLHTHPLILFQSDNDVYKQTNPIKYYLDLPHDVRLDSHVPTYIPSTHIIPLEISTTTTYSTKTNLTIVESKGKTPLLDFHRGAYINYIDHETPDLGEDGYIEPTPLDPSKRILFISLQVDDILPDFIQPPTPQPPPPPQRRTTTPSPNSSTDVDYVLHSDDIYDPQAEFGDDPDVPMYHFKIWFTMHSPRQPSWCALSVDIFASPAIYTAPPMFTHQDDQILDHADAPSLSHVFKNKNQNENNGYQGLNGSEIRLIRHMDPLPSFQQFHTTSEQQEEHQVNPTSFFSAIQSLLYKPFSTISSVPNPTARGYLNFTFINPSNETITHMEICQLGYTYTKAADHVTMYHNSTTTNHFPPSNLDTQYYRLFYPYGKQQSIILNNTFIWYSPSQISLPATMHTESFHILWSIIPKITYQHNVTREIAPAAWFSMFPYYFTTKDIPSTITNITTDQSPFVRSAQYDPIITQHDYDFDHDHDDISSLQHPFVLSNVSTSHLKTNGYTMRRDEMNNMKNINTNNDYASHTDGQTVYPGYTISVWRSTTLLYHEVVNVQRLAPETPWSIDQLLHIIAILSVFLAVVLVILFLVCIVLCFKKRTVQASKERTALRKEFIKQTQYGEFANTSSFSSNNWD